MHPVFISYARTTNRDHAEALFRELGPEQAFLDRYGIEEGLRFPPELTKALIAARVVVVFADELYFKRWFCLREFHLATAPYQQHLQSSPTREDGDDLLSHIVIALPAEISASTVLMQLPSSLRSKQWPLANDVKALKRHVEKRLAIPLPTVGERIQATGLAGADVQARWLEEAALPPPETLGGMRLFPPEIPFPSIGNSFVGRADDLWRIHHLIYSLRGEFSGAALSGSLKGAGGFGKTRLALEYVHRFGRRFYPGGVFWVDADVSEVQLEEQLHGILRTLNPQSPDLRTLREQGRDVAKELASSFQALSSAAPVLYVIDNIPEPAEGELLPPLRKWCPALGKVTVLATSRITVALGQEGIREIPIDVLAPSAALLLLTEEISREPGDQEEWRSIAEWVGHLPLALILLNRAIRLGGITRAELIDKIQLTGPVDILDRQSKALKGAVPDNTLYGISAAFSLSYERLSEIAQRAIRILSFLSHESIPEALLNTLGGEIFSPEVRIALKKNSFITPTHSVSVLFFGSMHRVLADFLRNQSEDTAEEAQIACEGLARLMSHDLALDPRKWPLMDACLPHAERVLEHLKDVNEASYAAATRAALEHQIGMYLSEKGYAARARKHQEKVVAWASNTLGREMPFTVNAMSNLARTLLAQGEFSLAQELQEDVLATHRRLHGEDSLETVTATGNLAAMLWKQGEWNQARELHEKAVAGFQQLLGEEHPDTLRAKSSFALVLTDQGDLSGAQRLQEQILEVRQKILEPSAPEILKSKNNLAWTLSSQGDLGKAQALQEDVLNGVEQLYGSEHPETSNAMCNLASTLGLQGKLAAARALQEKALELYRRVLTEKHPNTLRAMNDLAVTLHRQGEFSLAQNLQEQTLAVLREVLGEKHPETIKALNNLALTYLRQGNLPAARALQTKALDTCRESLGPEHPQTLSFMGNLASTLHKQGESAEAMHLEKEVLDICCRVLGPEHPQTLRALTDFAATFNEQGDLAQARRLLEQAFDRYRRIFGMQHPDTLMCMKHLARTMYLQGEVAVARALQEQILETRLSTAGREHPETLNDMNALAEMLQSAGDLMNARMLRETALDILTRTHGRDHLDTLAMVGNLAIILHKEGDLARARALQEEVLNAFSAKLGKLHPDTLTAMNNLAQYLFSQGELTAARKFQTEALDLSRQVFGEEHPETLRMMVNLAGILKEHREWNAAQELQRRALAGRTRLFGRGHPSTVKVMVHLAQTLRAEGKLAESCALLEEVLSIHVGKHGQEHPETLGATLSLIEVLRENGQSATADVLESQARETLRRLKETGELEHSND